MLNNFYYLILTISIFFCFTIIISIFGYFFLLIIESRLRKKWELVFLEKYIISFGIGLSIYIPICYLIVNLGIMNFFTLNFPFILIDIFILFFLFKRKEVSTPFNLSKSNLIFYSITIIGILIDSFFAWEFISSNNSLFGTDPLIWIYKVSKLEEGILIDWNTLYPEGFNIFCVSILSLAFSPDFQLTYYFLKFMPIPFLAFFIFTSALLIKRVFKKNYLVLYGIIIILTANFMHHRFLQFLPSNVAILLMIISIFLFTIDCPLYILGIFIGSIFLINPLIAFYGILSIFLCSLIHTIKFKFYLKRAFFSFIKFFSIFLLFIIPYLIFLILNGVNLFDFVRSYFDTLGITEKYFSITILENNVNSIFLNLSSLDDPLYDFFTNWIPEYPPWDKNFYLNNSLIFSPHFILGIIGFIFPIRKNVKSNNRRLYLFLKSIMIIIFLFLFFPIFFPQNLLTQTIPFWMCLRILEIFVLPIVLIECYGIFNLVNVSKKMNSMILSKLRKIRKLNKKSRNKFVKINKILILIVLVSAMANYRLNSIEKDRFLFYYFEDDQINSVLFIKNNIPPNSRILFPDLTHSTYNKLYVMLWDYNYTIWDYNLNNIYNSTIEFIEEYNISYLMIDLHHVSSEELNEFLNSELNFIIIYQNSRDIILHH